MPGSEVNQAHTKIGPVIALADRANGHGGFRVLVTGDATLSRDFTQLSESDLQTGEAIGIPIALLILLAVFGTVVAALVPVVLALFSIVVALALAALIGHISPLSFFVVNMLTFMGLAVGIDYSLFIVSRYREERRGGREQLDAMTVAGDTASRAVLFSGMTVVLALVGMLIVPTKIFVSLAAGAILAVLVAVVAALTLLPAMLSLLGDRIEALRVPVSGAWPQEQRPPPRRLVADRRPGHAPPGDRARGHDRHPARRRDPVHEHPHRLLGRLQPARQRQRQAGIPDPESRLLRRRRHAGGDRGRRRDRHAGRPAGVPPAPERAWPRPPLRAAAPRPHPAKRLAVITVPVAGDPNSNSALNAVRDLRSSYLPTALRGSGLHAYVDGASAQNLDYFAITDRYLPIVFALVLGLSFVLLTLAFRSIVVPASSIVMNLLSVGAAYGLLVLVTQQGVGAGVFGFQQVPVVEAWIPLFLFSVLFGLSMDYQVFLLSRIRERYDQRGDSRESVAYGIGSTAQLITGAALIMVAVFAGFAAGQLVMFQQMGFGLGVAILIDATLVRTILMPAWMELLGDRSWYLPHFLAWLPDLRVESTPGSAPAASTGD